MKVMSLRYRTSKSRDEIVLALFNVLAFVDKMMSVYCNLLVINSFTLS